MVHNGQDDVRVDETHEPTPEVMTDDAPRVNRREVRVAQAYEKLRGWLPTRETLDRGYKAVRIIIIAVDDVAALYNFPTGRGGT